MQEPWCAPIREAAEPSSSCRAAKTHTHPTFLTTQTYVTLPVRATLGELWHGGSGTLSPGQKHSAGRVQEAMLHSSVITGISQHAKKDTRTPTQGKVERDPLCQQMRACKVNAARVCTGLPMTDGAQVPLGRQTTASLGRATGKWWMLPSPSHIWNEIKTEKEVGDAM